MEPDEVFHWLGLVFLVLGSLSLSVIALRRSAWFGRQRSIFSKWDETDIKLAKTAAILFGIFILLFMLAAIF